MTANTLPLRCQCGTIQGELTELRKVNRALCYCKDCQAFARVLGQESRVLDPLGGSDIIQVLPKSIRFTQGSEALACLRLGPKGILRWYAGCCRTPIGNTLPTRKLSFIGLVHTCLAPGQISLDEAFGPVTAWVHTQSANGSPKPKQVGVGKSIGWFIRTTLKARLNGDYKLTPFFHPETGAPVATPVVLASRDGHLP
jgi:Family of unknown function (DUF6151)